MGDIPLLVWGAQVYPPDSVCTTGETKNPLVLLHRPSGKPNLELK